MEDAEHHIRSNIDKPVLYQRFINIFKGKVKIEYISDSPKYDSYELDESDVHFRG